MSSNPKYIPIPDYAAQHGHTVRWAYTVAMQRPEHVRFRAGALEILQDCPPPELRKRGRKPNNTTNRTRYGKIRQDDKRRN